MHFKQFLTETIMRRISFECSCTQSRNVTHTIFNSEPAMVNLYNIYELDGNTGIFTSVRAQTDGRWQRTDE